MGVRQREKASALLRASFLHIISSVLTLSSKSLVASTLSRNLFWERRSWRRNREVCSGSAGWGERMKRREKCSRVEGVDYRFPMAVLN